MSLKFKEKISFTASIKALILAVKEIALSMFEDALLIYNEESIDQLI